MFHLLNTANCKLLLTLTPVTSISLRQFSAVSCVHRCPSTHQSHGKLDETHCVHELYVLQSKNVKFVVTKSGPDVIRTDSLAVKWSATTTTTTTNYRLQHNLFYNFVTFAVQSLTCLKFTVQSLICLPFPVQHLPCLPLTAQYLYLSCIRSTEPILSPFHRTVPVPVLHSQYRA